ncbi:MAG TPA: Gfo/Idh/MocA family oxidoreductase, partial [Gemmatimonadaceae bacterium]
VVICVPSHLHVPVATAAFDAGLHVYLEKPIALSLAEGERLVEAWRRARTVGMIGFNFRFHPQVVRIRERLGDGAIGTPLGVRAIFSILPHELPEWKRTRGSGGGVLLDLASHHIDLVHYLFADDPVVRVFASVRSLSGEGDHAAVQLELASGLMVQLFVSLGTVDEHRIEIVGTTGKLVMDRTELVRPDHVPATQQGARARRLARALAALEPARVLRSPGMEPSFDAALGAFVSSASGPDSSHGLRSSPDLHGLRSSPDLIDGLRSLAVVEAAERSAASGAAESVAWPPSLPAPRPLATSAGR